ncbi:uncharacterized protein LOC106073996 [Biomphalaria glabrata]|nr:uncharacterized protein LOC106073996 [Biomphalaria glabrata]
MDHNHNYDCVPDAKYHDYIQHNLDRLKEKCSKLTDCIDKLLEEENAIVVLKGDNISLNKTCGLIYKPENGNYTTLRGKCSPIEREEIRSDIEDGLNDMLDKNRTWKNVNTCLKNRYGDIERTTRVEEVCLLAKNRKEICNNTTTHKTVERFFNSEIQNLQCRCQLLEHEGEENETSSNEMSTGAIIGIGIACFVVLVAIFCLIFFCYRRKHLKKSKNKPNVVYMAPPGQDAVYQELFDDKIYKGFPPNQPPNLPSRYVQHSQIQDDSGYLEPVMAGMKYRPMPPIPGQASNPGYESPPRYSQYEKDTATPEVDTENGYFKPLPEPSSGTLNAQADSDKERSENSGYEPLSGSRSSLPLEDAPVPEAPIPAKRSKSGNKSEESHYFELENGGASKEDRNTV